MGKILFFGSISILVLLFFADAYKNKLEKIQQDCKEFLEIGDIALENKDYEKAALYYSRYELCQELKKVKNKD